MYQKGEGVQVKGKWLYHFLAIQKFKQQVVITNVK